MGNFKANEEVVELPIGVLDDCPFNERVVNEADADIIELGTNLNQHGVLIPLLVRQGKKDRYEVLDGKRRKMAAKLAGTRMLPVRVIENCTDEMAHEIILISDAQRKNLTGLERSRVACALRKLNPDKWNIKTIATEIGCTPRVVAELLKVEALTPAWKEAIADAKLPFRQWPVSHFAYIACLVNDSQNRMLGQLKQGLKEAKNQTWRDENRMAEWGLEDIEDIAGRMMFVLTSAPWKLDDAELCPAAGACIACPKRSSHDRDLFDMEKGDKNDQCLDAACWQIKHKTFVEISAKELKTKHGVEPIKISDRKTENTPDDVMYPHQIQQVKKTDKNAVPAIVVEGPKAGETMWIAKPAEKKETRSSYPKPREEKPKTIEMRRAELTAKRHQTAIANVIEKIDKVKLKPDQKLKVDGKEYAAAQVIACFASKLGSDHISVKAAGVKEGYRIDIKSDVQTMLRNGKDAFTSPLFDMIKAQFGFWLAADYPFAADRHAKQIADIWDAAQWVAGIFNINAKSCLDAAIAKHPEPKAWKKQESDAAAKAQKELRKAKASEPDRRAAAAGK